MKLKLIGAILLNLLLVMVIVIPAYAHEGVGGDELASADSMLVLAVGLISIAAAGVFFSIRNGEFQDPEIIKTRMLELALADDQGDDLEQYALTEAS